MMSIQRAQRSQSAEVAALIFASEPTLLSFLFGGQDSCRTYLMRACEQDHGQFSAHYHWVTSATDGSVAGTCATWLARMPVDFQSGTINALRDFLSAQQIIHLLAYKELLDSCFIPPTAEQLCLGHLSVIEQSKRKGLATGMIQHAIAEAKELRLHELVLDVDIANADALACYLKLGFQAVQQTCFEPTQQTFARMALAV